VKNRVKPYKAFTLLEVLISVILFSVIIVVSIKAYSYFTNSSQENVINYLALAKADSEMNRLVYAYENLYETDFTEDALNSDSNQSETSWMNFFKGGWTDSNSKKKIYKVNPLNESYGLLVSGNDTVTALRNTIEIIDNNDNPNSVEVGDIVGMMAWRVHHIPDESNPTHVYLSLSLTYPYLVTKIRNYDNENIKVVHKNINGSFIRTINLKTATQVKQ
jgi:type II secretory pathway pseudopilin PulG